MNTKGYTFYVQLLLRKSYSFRGDKNKVREGTASSEQASVCQLCKKGLAPYKITNFLNVQLEPVSGPL